MHMRIWNTSSATSISYVNTVGLNDATIAKYVREQEQHDQPIDKLRVKKDTGSFETKEPR